MASLSRAHPELRIEVLDRLALSPRRVLFDLRLPANPGVSWREELGRLPGVVTVALVGGNPRSEIYRVLYTGRTFVPLAAKLRILRRFPFPVQDGVATWTVVGPEPGVRDWVARLRRSRIAFRVDSVRRGLRSEERRGLTDRQREVLHRAATEGYFEVPRRVSLTQLALRMGVAPSTLSVTLAVIERKILLPVVAGEEAPGGGSERAARP